MSYFSVDVEADGPVPGPYSLVCFGAVLVKDGFNDTFYGTTKPISANHIPEALAISGFSRQEHEKFDDPRETFLKFRAWLTAVNAPGTSMIFITDNLAFDWQWINYYFHVYGDGNPFGFSGRRIGDMYAGLVKDPRKPWKKELRTTKHDHNPVNDAKGNAEAILVMRDKYGLNIKLK